MNNCIRLIILLGFSLNMINLQAEESDSIFDSPSLLINSLYEQNDYLEINEKYIDSEKDFKLLFNSLNNDSISLYSCGQFYKSNKADTLIYKLQDFKELCSKRDDCECNAKDKTLTIFASTINDGQAELWMVDETINPKNITGMENGTVVISFPKFQSNSNIKQLDLLTIRDTLRISLSLDSNLKVVADEMSPKPSEPRGNIILPPHILSFNGNNANNTLNAIRTDFQVLPIFPLETEKPASKKFGVPIHFIDFIVKKDLIILRSTTASGVKQELVFILKDQLTSNLLLKVHTFALSVASSIYGEIIETHALVNSATTLDSWSPGGLNSTYQRVQYLNLGNQFEIERLVQMARASAWIAFLSSRSAPMLANEQAAFAIALTERLNNYKQLTAITLEIQQLALAGAFRDEMVLGLIPHQPVLPEVNAFYQVFQNIVNQPIPKKGEVPPFYQALANTYSYLLIGDVSNQSTSWLNTISRKDYSEALMYYTSFGTNNAVMKAVRRSNSSSQLAKSLADTVESLCESFETDCFPFEIPHHQLTGYLDDSHATSLANIVKKTRLIELKKYSSLSFNEFVGEKSGLWHKAIEHRFLMMGYYQTRMWSIWGSHDSNDILHKNMLDDLLKQRSESAEHAMQWIMIDSINGTKNKPWKSRYNQATTISQNWAKAYPILKVAFPITNTNSNIELAWISQGIKAPNIQLRILKAEPLHGALKIQYQKHIPPLNYLGNYNGDAPSWLLKILDPHTPAEFKKHPNFIFRHALSLIDTEDTKRQGTEILKVLHQQNPWLQGLTNKLSEIFVGEKLYEEAIQVQQNFIAAEPLVFLGVSGARSKIMEIALTSGDYDLAYQQAKIAKESSSSISRTRFITTTFLAEKYDELRETIKSQRKHYGDLSYSDTFYDTLSKTFQATSDKRQRLEAIFAYMKDMKFTDRFIKELYVVLKRFDLLDELLLLDSEQSIKYLQRAVQLDLLSEQQLTALNNSDLDKANFVAKLFKESKLKDPISTLKKVWTLEPPSTIADAYKKWSVLVDLYIGKYLAKAAKEKSSDDFVQLIAQLTKSEYWVKLDPNSAVLQLIQKAQEEKIDQQDVSWLIDSFRMNLPYCDWCDVIESVNKEDDGFISNSVFGTSSFREVIFKYWLNNQDEKAYLLLESIYQISKYQGLSSLCSNYSQVTALLSQDLDLAENWLVKMSMSHYCLSNINLSDNINMLSVARKLRPNSKSSKEMQSFKPRTNY
tara:strand:- start:350 stop:4036 length:3687 start_codon:yes stop_codon:yes gene_type:complete